MASSSQQSPPTSKSPTALSNPKSSFGIRFHQVGRPNVYFRSNPDLTSDLNQVWVHLDTSEIKFENYSPTNMPRALVSTLPQDESEGEVDIRGTKRQKTDLPKQSKPVKGFSVTAGFRVDKPIQAGIPDDIWRIILKESHPTVLLIIKNLSHYLHDLLQEQSIWKASREKLHGANMPGPPGEMTEQRYAHLLYGQGCDFQRSKCGSNVTKKVYWPFLLRMCDACFRRKIEKVCGIRAVLLLTRHANFFLPLGQGCTSVCVSTDRMGHLRVDTCRHDELRKVYSYKTAR
jgi:hypothetical protein